MVFFDTVAGQGIRIKGEYSIRVKDLEWLKIDTQMQVHLGQMVNLFISKNHVKNSVLT